MNKFYDKFRRVTNNKFYLAEIDGMRAFITILIIIFHINGYFLEKTSIHFSEPVSNHLFFNTTIRNIGRTIELFFIISGFILCMPFANHYLKGGKKMPVKKYYIRRITRIEPPYFIALTSIFILEIIMKVHPFSVLFPSYLASAVYAHDFIYHHTPLVTVVAYTLEVEIQFYLLAPLLFKMLALPTLPRRTLLFAGIIGAVIIQEIYPPTFQSIYGYFQYFFAGMLLADFYTTGAGITFFKQKWMAPFSLVVFFAMFYVPMETEFYGRLLFPLVSLLFYCMILRVDVVKKFFGYKLLPIIGGMTYTFYLLHYTIISIFGRFTIKIHFTDSYFLNLAIQVGLLAIPIAVFSGIYYYYVERPFMSNALLERLFSRKKKDEEPATRVVVPE